MGIRWTHTTSQQTSRLLDAGRYSGQPADLTQSIDRFDRFRNINQYHASKILILVDWRYLENSGDILFEKKQIFCNGHGLVGLSKHQGPGPEQIMDETFQYPWELKHNKNHIVLFYNFGPWYGLVWFGMTSQMKDLEPFSTSLLLSLRLWGGFGARCPLESWRSKKHWRHVWLPSQHQDCDKSHNIHNHNHGGRSVEIREKLVKFGVWKLVIPWYPLTLDHRLQGHWSISVEAKAGNSIFSKIDRAWFFSPRIQNQLSATLLKRKFAPANSWIPNPNTSRNLQRHLNLCTSTLSIPKATSRDLNHLFVMWKYALNTILQIERFCLQHRIWRTLQPAAYFNLSRGYLSLNVCNSPGMNIFLQDSNAQKRRAKKVTSRGTGASARKSVFALNFLVFAIILSWLRVICKVNQGGRLEWFQLTHTFGVGWSHQP